MPLFRAAGAGQPVRAKGPQIGLSEQPRRDALTVVGGVGRAVLDGAVVVDEAGESGVLHAVALFGGRGHQHPLGER